MNIPWIVNLGEGSSVTIKDMRIRAGNFLDDAETYRSNNPIVIDGHRTTVADEELSVYSAMDYISAVGQVTRFVAKVVGAWDERLSGPWDSALADAMQTP